MPTTTSRTCCPTTDGVREFAVGELAGRRHDDSGAHMVQRYRAALQAIADGHRGETALVFSHGGVMSFALPRLRVPVRADLIARSFLPNCGVAELAAGAEGFEVTAWAGPADRTVV